MFSVLPSHYVAFIHRINNQFCRRDSIATGLNQLPTLRGDVLHLLHDVPRTATWITKLPVGQLPYLTLVLGSPRDASRYLSRACLMDQLWAGSAFRRRTGLPDAVPCNSCAGRPLVRPCRATISTHGDHLPPTTFCS